ncbi:serum paraoxonase/arylesterase [Punctularia strigosozonata HHB-11173 SS5]|uniref:serum paraoxonase/arylesterase n=1 Tax=Punctularia strigosozonata (strain HHB-11173) TaxID=741275 RepID=UPI0004417AFC|nr:serum paraoxonase/arylesterase [Punctularia strigosozonata HHB-11173 SS5]EIN11802.1 serum paraoxonase/arylesterase [Punctularia strigosozonata HHB-11173 SS5]
MTGATVTVGLTALAILLGIYQVHFKPIITGFGLGRVVEPKGNTDCHTVPDVQACEKLVLHQPSGSVYLACSTPASRVQWMPTVNHFNASGMNDQDYVAVYDPPARKVTRLSITGFESPRGLSVHGMDVVPSSTDPSQLFVYVVNHRAPHDGQDANQVGADSSVEIFRTSVGGSTMVHVATVEDPVIVTPNDLVGSPDGKSFWFTNDHGSKTSLTRHLEHWRFKFAASVGYCHLDEGCRFAVQNLPGANGIARNKHDVFYVANDRHPEIRVLEKQADNSLVVTDLIKPGADYPIDNLVVDENGYLWASGTVNCLQTVFKHFEDPSIIAPSSALRISLNTGRDAYFGEKYKIEKGSFFTALLTFLQIFEDDGELAPGVTSVAYDVDRKQLFLHGLASPHLTVCNIEVSTSNQVQL